MLALLALGISCAGPAAGPDPDYPPVMPGVEFRFPRDHGAHPAYRTEWWYFTGWLQGADGKPLGFQITFFRSRPSADPSNPSAFAPRQILFAHAALSDPVKARLIHDRRIARAGFGLATAAEGDARIRLLDWRLDRRADGIFRAHVPARDFALDLAFAPTQPVMVNGDRGYSRKGPRPEQASYYYSMPQLAVTGTVVKDGKPIAVKGRAWLDREWSSTLLPPNAAGWDWTGINFDDGAALMAFQVRGRDGHPIHAGGTMRRPDGSQIVLAPADVRFVPRRRWRSPQTGAVYPVEADFIVRLPEGVRRVRLKPLFDAQELDGRAGAMPVYWEGLVSTQSGRGYLELTGYAGALRF
ncbi:carotenoid 1,2-hydratase [Sphingomonas oleivorans]|uniref:Carotenoid 1,2-hydratase n=2 Tax=Sphingomonas oleivorans TaxID=1735121 RepID=A0A2T5G357_9SPHN|nr:carotenoid 1,2-hydratase [Sphingomonas oleivorans]